MLIYVDLFLVIPSYHWDWPRLGIDVPLVNIPLGCRFQGKVQGKNNTARKKLQALRLTCHCANLYIRPVYFVHLQTHVGNQAWRL